MMRALWTAASGMAAQQTNVDVIANNLSNVNTTGFKRSRAEFQDLMYQTIRQAGSITGPDNQAPTGLQIGLGVKQVATANDFTEGSLQATGNPLDVAVQGDGFFQITMPDGTTAYTRDGSFKEDSQGRIVTSDGYFLQPQITIPSNATSISISSTGVISATVTGQAAPQQLGQIQIATFVNPAGLSKLGQNLYQETAASGTPTVNNPGTDSAGTLVQQYLESSNVQVVSEMVNMIVAQRAYEMNSKSISTCSQMLQTASQLNGTA